MNDRTRLARQLADDLMARLEETPGQWVPYSDLLALAPEGRIIVIPELDGEQPFAADYAHGGAYDAGPSGKPDGGMLAGCLHAVEGRLKGTLERLDEGYPDGGSRAFRLITSPEFHAGDVIVIPHGMQHEGDRAELTEHILDTGPDRWTARVLDGDCAGEVITIARGWAEAAADPVGLEEIAARLGVPRGTADKWRTRGVLPEPAWTVGGRPAWPWHAIADWARETGRLPARG